MSIYKFIKYAILFSSPFKIKDNFYIGQVLAHLIYHIYLRRNHDEAQINRS